MVCDDQTRTVLPAALDDIQPLVNARYRDTYLLQVHREAVYTSGKFPLDPVNTGVQPLLDPVDSGSQFLFHPIERKP